ncbi:hypothetical protein DLAC_10891 [Tieghemostelium lacteum]|uniref:NADH:ubiquinone oxidoreductase intermediate-associated protein 30 domain-containing protein n=1 Tax=Tieghemostelium lacteum TaxID=361077 RepID=A0A151Z2M3_TIELA|nr:hypothetical protein DLAC_10891 [Tieghemostelium lacteum]|eukprot:KYQ88205.1 hypothetical protein DLAC_10891 [Tieghemostelium lacteum]
MTNKITKGIYNLYRDFVHFDFAKPLEEKLLVSFETAESLNKWRLITDKEIGGFSTAQLKYNDSTKTMKFCGNISKELPKDNERIKNSGYAGTYLKEIDSEHTSIDWNKFKSLEIRVHSNDKRCYTMGILNREEKQIMYKQLFTTTPGVWETLELDLDDFFKVVKGNLHLNIEKMPRNSIYSLGFVQSEKTPGPFELDIQYIKLIPPGRQANTLDPRLVSSKGRVIKLPEYE